MCTIRPWSIPWRRFYIKYNKEIVFLNFDVDTHNCPFTFFVTLTDLLFLLYKTFFCICYVFLSFYHFTIFFVFPHFCNSVSLLVQFFIFQKDFFFTFSPKEQKTKEEISLCNWCDHFWWRSVVFERSSSISWSPHHFFFRVFSDFYFYGPDCFGARSFVRIPFFQSHGLAF